MCNEERNKRRVDRPSPEGEDNLMDTLAETVNELNIT